MPVPVQKRPRPLIDVNVPGLVVRVAAQILEQREVIALQAEVSLGIDLQIAGDLFLRLRVTAQQVVRSAEIGVDAVVVRKFRHRLF